DVHRGVVAPARVRGALHPRPIDDDAFAQSHLTRRIAGQPPGVPDAWVDVGPIDYAVAQTHVPLFVLGDAAHPAMDPVARRVGTLLKERVVAPGSLDLVPTHAGRAWRCLNGLIGYERLVSLE